MIVLFVPGCGGGTDLGQSADQIEKTAGDSQIVPAGSRLPSPLTVTVRSRDGTALPRVKIRWKTSSGGVLSDSATLSDASGHAQVEFTVGSSATSYPVVAQIGTKPDRTVTFTAQATTAPSLTSVTPSQFSGGDVVTLQGSALSSSAVIEIGGAPARVISGTTTSLSVVIPICLAPGPTQIRALVNGAPSNAINGLHVISADIQLAVGDYASIDPVQLPGCATFPDAGLTGAEYLVAPQAATSVTGLTADYRLSGNSAVTSVHAMAPPPTPEDPPPTAARVFHDFLRVREAEISRISRSRDSLGAAMAGPAAQVPPKVGDQRDFHVCNKLGCQNLPDFSTIQARAKYVGSHVVIFQDVAAPAGGFNDDEFGAFGAEFNDVLYDVDNKAFGSESDIDQNGLVFVLLTPQVNRLTPSNQCSGAVIVGFFYAIDIDPGFAADQRANQAEVFYSVVPDPQGSNGCAIPKDKIGQIVPSTFIHEFQHMISYGQHVLFRAGHSEDLWLNEAMSHLAEELGGFRLKEMGDNQAFSDFVIGNLFNGYQYLKVPGSNFMLYEAGTGTLAERGGSWLFLRWLVDRFGTGISRRMEETSLVGTANVASATGEPVSRLLAQWFLANWVSDLPGFTAPSRLRYETWAFRTTYASLNQQQPARYDRPYPLVPQTFGTTFAVNGTLRSGSGDYFRVIQGSGQSGFTLALRDQSGGPLSTAIQARLNVVRIK